MYLNNKLIYIILIIYFFSYRFKKTKKILYFIFQSIESICSKKSWSNIFFIRRSITIFLDRRYLEVFFYRRYFDFILVRRCIDIILVRRYIDIILVRRWINIIFNRIWIV